MRDFLRTGQYQDIMPKFKKGGSGNPGGRPKVLHEVRATCQKRGQEIVDRLFEIANDKKATTYGRVVALKTLAAYAWGNPISQAAVHLLDHRRDDADGGEVVVQVAFGRPAIPLSEFAATDPPQQKFVEIEDLRPAALATSLETRQERHARLQGELEENEREIARLQRVAAERQPWGVKKSDWPMDVPPKGDWPGRYGS